MQRAVVAGFVIVNNVAWLLLLYFMYSQNKADDTPQVGVQVVSRSANPTTTTTNNNKGLTSICSCPEKPTDTLYTAGSKVTQTGDPTSGDAHGLFASVQVARWPFSRNWDHLGSGYRPKEVWIEVGANGRDLLRDEMERYNAFQNRGAFLLSFEPLLDKYGNLLKGSPDKRANLGSQHKYGLAFPYAVGCKGSATFNVAPIDGCSSLLDLRGKDDLEADPTANTWTSDTKKSCATVTERRTVPCVSLEFVIGNWLGAQYDVAHLKIDAQGFDLQVALSAGQHMDKIKTITMEVVSDKSASLYKDGGKCSSAVLELEKHGFICQNMDVEHCKTGRRKKREDPFLEYDLYFARPGFEAVVPGDHRFR